MHKQSLVFCGPVETESGYGEHARDILLSLAKMNKFNIIVTSINWGNTPMTALDDDTPTNHLIKSLIRRTPVTVQPDVWVQVTIPNEFRRVGKYNIGITAGIETDSCPPEWVEGCNVMDLIIVPSKHVKTVFESAEYWKFDKVTNAQLGVIKIDRPIEILPEGVQADIFNQIAPIDEEFSNDITRNIFDGDSSRFGFLFVGRWLKGDVGQDRKDISGLIIHFIKAFSGDSSIEQKPVLVLKTAGAGYSITERSDVIRKIDLLRKMVGIPIDKQPDIRLIHGELTHKEMNTLYNHPAIRTMISFTKGEGFGRPLAEFIPTGKPIIVSGWSGQVDFVNPVFHTFLNGEVKEVHESAVWNGIINKGSKWFTVDYTQATEKMLDIVKNYQRYLSNSKKSVVQFLTHYSYASMHHKFIDMLDRYLPKPTKRVPMTLPKLKSRNESVPNKEDTTKI
jgi:hypothetical protein